MDALRNWAQGIDLNWFTTELMVVIVAVISLTFHEFSHATAAFWLGDDTAKRAGRLSLNPLRHISWPGLLMLAIVRFGWAKPVPVNMYRFKKPKLGMALTALAGPLSNVLLALLGSLLQQILLNVIWSAPYHGIIDKNSFLYFAMEFAGIFTMLNAGLAVFNLIPISPLDGSKVLAMFLPDRAHAWLMRYERYGMLILMALLFLGVLTVPLTFLRNGLTNGLYHLTALFFPSHPAN